MTTRVLVDANVLHPRTLRDWLLMLKLQTGTQMFTLASTEDILAETIHSIRRRYPHMAGGVMARTRELITQTLDEMIRDYPVGDFPGADINDSHVHGAAVHAQVDILLTNDTGWDRVADQLPYDIYRTDDFFLLVSDSAPRAVADVACQQIQHQLARGADEVDLVASLKSAQCPQFAERVRQLLQTIDFTPGSTT